MDHHLTFNVAVILLSALVLAVSIPNIYYYEQLYANGGTQNMGSHSCLFMTILNIAPLILSTIMGAWGVIRVLGPVANGKASKY